MKMDDGGNDIDPLLDFFIIGSQKSGTTALNAYLSGHEEIQMSSYKEIHYFDNEKNDWGAPSYDRLHQFFDWSVKGVFRGEATPVYLYWPESLARLRTYNPDAKLIVGFRHPVYRAFSHWRMEIRRGREPMSFTDATTSVGRQRVATAPQGVHRIHSYVERGFYAPQIERLLALFPRSQVHFYKTDTLWTDPRSALGQVERFLGVAPRVSVTAEPTYTVHVDSRGLGEIPEGDRSRLQAVYDEDIAATARLTGLDLSDWNGDYRDVMAA